MQPIKLTVCCLGALFILLSCGVRVPKPPQGWDVGNGGDAFAAEFKDIARTVVRRWTGLPEKVIGHAAVGEVTVKSFEQALEKVAVKTTEEELRLEGNIVDAMNYADKNLIVLSLKRWAKDMPFPEKRRLVIHEILGLLGKEKSLHYDLTSLVLSTLDFYREIPIYHFMVDGKPAQTFVEKVAWLPAEISVDERKRVTQYHLPVTGVRGDRLQCSKTEYVNPDTGGPLFLYKCDIKCFYAVMSDDSSIRVSLDREGELYKRFFNGKTSFDYGVLRGEEGLEPMISVYFDRF